MANFSRNVFRKACRTMLFVPLMGLIIFIICLSAFISVLAQAHNVSVQTAYKEVYSTVPLVSCRSGSVCVSPGLYHFSSCTDPSWSYPNSYTAWVRSHGSVACNYANWNNSSYTGSRTCAVRVYVPNNNATATISYGIFGTNGSLLALVSINQNNVFGYQTLTNGLYGIGYVHIADNNGQTGSQIGADTTVGSVEFTCH